MYDRAVIDVPVALPGNTGEKILVDVPIRNGTLNIPSVYGAIALKQVYIILAQWRVPCLCIREHRLCFVLRQRTLSL